MCDRFLLHLLRLAVSGGAAVALHVKLSCLVRSGEESGFFLVGLGENISLAFIEVILLSEFLSDVDSFLTGSGQSLGSSFVEITMLLLLVFMASWRGL